MKDSSLQSSHGLRLARRPFDYCFFDLGILTQSEMEPALVLGGVTVAARDLLHLLPAVPIEPNAGADGAAITLRPFELELYPLILRYCRVFVNQERPFLVGDDDVQHA